MKICKKISLGAVAALALSCPVYAQDPMMAPATSMSTTSTMMAPMPASGTVLRYYVDRAGFVSAMDVQTADGIRMVRFSPSMAQKLSMMYPVGSTINGYVTSYMSDGMTNYYLAGATDKMPVPGAVMMPDMVSDTDVLKSVPYTTIGAKPERFTGKITGYVSDPGSGDVLALVVDNTTLVRVPMENRLSGPMNAPEGITPIYNDSMVDGFGYPESMRYGSVSPFSKRIIATGISVDGRALGALGFGKVGKSKMKSSMMGSTMGGTMSAQEMSAGQMGYMTYTPSPAMDSGMGSTSMPEGVPGSTMTSPQPGMSQ